MGQGPWKWTKINQGQWGLPLGVHFSGLWPIWGPQEGSEAKLRLFLGQIFTVRNDSYRCPTHITIFFMLNLHLLRAFQAIESQI